MKVLRLFVVLLAVTLLCGKTQAQSASCTINSVTQRISQSRFLDDVNWGYEYTLLPGWQQTVDLDIVITYAYFPDGYDIDYTVYGPPPTAKAMTTLVGYNPGASPISSSITQTTTVNVGSLVTTLFQGNTHGTPLAIQYHYNLTAQQKHNTTTLTANALSDTLTWHFGTG